MPAVGDLLGVAVVEVVLTEHGDPAVAIEIGEEFVLAKAAVAIAIGREGLRARPGAHQPRDIGKAEPVGIADAHVIERFGVRGGREHARGQGRQSCP